VDLFERLAAKGTPEAVHEDPTEKLLQWLIKSWGQPTITARDIYRHAPSPIYHDITMILSLTRVLADEGWLISIPTWRRDKREWKIARGLPLKNWQK